MNSIVKAAARFSSMKSALNPVRQALVGQQNAPIVKAGTSRQFTRTLWHMCSSSDKSQLLKFQKACQMCSCGCSSGQIKVHTKGLFLVRIFLEQID
jgi:hypothetical protein